jgi:peroxiredoxin-like protein
MHDYPVSVQWTGGRDGKGTVSSKHSGTQTAIAVPPEFQGPGGGASPEELLTSAIASCYTITFGIIAANRKIPVKSIAVEAVGQVEQTGAQFTYKNVTVRPHITLEADATDEQLKIAEDMSHKADLYCIITNAVRGKVEITVEPTITKE